MPKTDIEFMCGYDSSMISSIYSWIRLQYDAFGHKRWIAFRIHICCILFLHFNIDIHFKQLRRSFVPTVSIFCRGLEISGTTHKKKTLRICARISIWTFLVILIVSGIMLHCETLQYDCPSVWNDLGLSNRITQFYHYGDVKGPINVVLFRQYV